ncbi:MAG TPA: preprotein translocase subunit YajC [Streptosporangiaceae bacterium]|nr:preprotein translocase subunit YajC [Streptosporangiaceae bacterium]
MGDIAAATAAASKSSSSSFTLLLLIALVFIGFYFLMIRPQQRRRQQAQQQQNTVTPGARVRTTAGMYATVSAVDGDDVVLEVAPGIDVRYMKRAIMEVIAPGEAEAGETAEDTHDGYAEDTHDGYAEDDVAEDDEPTDAHEDAESATKDLADSHDGTGSGNAF